MNEVEKKAQEMDEMEKKAQEMAEKFNAWCDEVQKAWSMLLTWCPGESDNAKMNILAKVIGADRRALGAVNDILASGNFTDFSDVNFNFGMILEEIENKACSFRQFAKGFFVLKFRDQVKKDHRKKEKAAAAATVNGQWGKG